MKKILKFIWNWIPSNRLENKGYIKLSRTAIKFQWLFLVFYAIQCLFGFIYHDTNDQSLFSLSYQIFYYSGFPQIVLLVALVLISIPSFFWEKSTFVNATK